MCRRNKFAASLTGSTLDAKNYVEEITMSLWVVTSCDCCSHYAGAIFGAPLPLAALSRCLAVGASIVSISFTDQSFSPE